MQEKYKCEVCGSFITNDEGITTLSGLWVCDNDTCRELDEENQAIEKIK
jgi:ribosomal protein L37AE/L43A